MSFHFYMLLRIIPTLEVAKIQIIFDTLFVKRERYYFISNLAPLSHSNCSYMITPPLPFFRLSLFPLLTIVPSSSSFIVASLVTGTGTWVKGDKGLSPCHIRIQQCFLIPQYIELFAFLTMASRWYRYPRSNLHLW